MNNPQPAWFQTLVLVMTGGVGIEVIRFILGRFDKRDGLDAQLRLELRQDREALKAEVLRLNEEMKKLRESNIELREEIAQLRNENTDLRGQLATLKTILTTLQPEREDRLVDAHTGKPVDRRKSAHREE